MPDPSSMSPDPQASYGQTALDLMNSGNTTNQLTGTIASGQAVPIAGTNLTVDELLGQIGLTQGQVALSNANAGLQGQYAEANNYIGQERLGIQGQGLEAQSKLEGTEYGLQQKALEGKAQQTDQAYGNQVANQQAQQAQSGAVGTKGQAQQIETGKSQFAYQQAQLQQEQQQQAASHAYSTGEIARGQAGLALSAQQNGLSLDQTLNQINYGMAQTGLQGQMTEDQLYGQIGQAQAQGATYASGALAQGALLGNVNLNGALAGG